MSNRKHGKRDGQSPIMSAKQDLSFSHKGEDDMETLDAMIAGGYYSNNDVIYR